MAWALGLFIGINLFMSGSALVMTAKPKRQRRVREGSACPRDLTAAVYRDGGRRFWRTVMEALLGFHVAAPTLPVCASICVASRSLIARLSSGRAA